MPRLLDDEKRVLSSLVAQLNRIEVKVNAIQALLEADHTPPVETDAEAKAAKLEFSPPSSSPSTTPPLSRS